MWLTDGAGGCWRVLCSGCVQRKKRGSKKVFVPYRDSVLTWLLKDNLGGNRSAPSSQSRLVIFWLAVDVGTLGI